MSRSDADAEIGLIQEYAIRSWVENGSALTCGRCQRVYVPSESSDPELCGSCVPLKDLAVGDRSPQHAKCSHCNGNIPGGKRNDSKFCSDSCRVLAHRRRRQGDSTTTRENAVRAEDGQVSARDLSVNKVAGRRVSAT